MTGLGTSLKAGSVLFWMAQRKVPSVSAAKTAGGGGDPSDEKEVYRYSASSLRLKTNEGITLVLKKPVGFRFSLFLYLPFDRGVIRTG